MTASPDFTPPEGFAPPEGFILHERSSPVTDPWKPIYARLSPGLVELGILVSTAHCNGRGFLHGGAIATAADNAMGLASVAAARAGARLIRVSGRLHYPCRLIISASARPASF